MASMSKSAKSLQSQWSALPCDLLSKIAGSLDTRVDILRFRAVCHSWRSSFPPPPKPPPPIKLPFHRCLSCSPFYTNCPATVLLAEYTVYALKPHGKIPKNESKTWIIKFQEYSESGKVSLKHPLYRITGKSVADSLPKVLNFLDYKVVEISKAYEIKVIEERETAVGFQESKYFWNIPVVVSSSSGLVDHSCVVMALLDQRLAVWRMGDEDWTFIDYEPRRFTIYACAAFHNGKFFAVDYIGFTLIVDPVSLELSSVNTESSFDGLRKYLVKASGDLFLVDKIDGASDLLRIYKFDNGKCNWVEVDGLNNQAFFLSEDHPFSISARDFKGCKWNCVYSTHDSSADFNDKHPVFDIRIYDLDNDTSKSLREFPGYSKNFWPPPTWLKKNTPAS